MFYIIEKQRRSLMKNRLLDIYVKSDVKSVGAVLP